MSNLDYQESRRESLIRERVSELMQSYYSIEHSDNVAEFCQEAPTNFFSDMAELIGSRHKYASQEYMEKLGRCFHCALSEYWGNMAKAQADKEVPSAVELHADALAEADEDRADR